MPPVGCFLAPPSGGFGSGFCFSTRAATPPPGSGSLELRPAESSSSSNCSRVSLPSRSFASVCVAAVPRFSIVVPRSINKGGGGCGVTLSRFSIVVLRSIDKGEGGCGVESV